MNCNIIQKSLEWCEGKVVMPGIRRRLYFISKNDIQKFPTLKTDENGRPISAVLEGSFVLSSDKYWKYIDILVDKSQLTSEAQGEYPSQTQLNKLTAVHPGTEEDATIGAANFNNTDNVYIVPTTSGKYRVLGNEMFQGKATFAQDLGQGSTGTASSTLTVEHTDLLPAPFYAGDIVISNDPAETIHCGGDTSADDGETPPAGDGESTPAAG